MNAEKGLIHAKLADLLADVPDIAKDGRNVQQGFSFRGIDQCYNVLHPLFAKHRVVVIPTVLEWTQSDRVTAKGGTLLFIVLKMAFDFYAEDGSCVRAVTLGQAMDSGDKAANKAMAVALKYALFQTFLIPTEETVTDPDADSHPASRPAAKPVTKPPAPAAAPGQTPPGPVCSCGTPLVLKTAGPKTKIPGEQYWTCPKSTKAVRHEGGFWKAADWTLHLEHEAAKASGKPPAPAAAKPASVCPFCGDKGTTAGCSPGYRKCTRCKGAAGKAPIFEE